MNKHKKQNSLMSTEGPLSRYFKKRRDSTQPYASVNYFFLSYVYLIPSLIIHWVTFHSVSQNIWLQVNGNLSNKLKFSPLKFKIREHLLRVTNLTSVLK